jgi:anti-anti-sigma regulatory factor
MTMATNLPESLAEDDAPAAAALRLPAELTIYTAAETRSAWLAWLAGEAGVDEPVCLVDASACTEVDAAGAQLLVALAHSLARRQRRLQLADAGAALCAACAELGLDDLLLGANAPEALA